MSNKEDLIAKEQEIEQSEVITFKKADLEAALEAKLSAVNEELKEVKKSFNLSGEAKEAKEKALEGAEKEAAFIRALVRDDVSELKAMHAERAKALNETTGSQGAFLVPEEFETSVLRYMDEFSQIRRNATVLSMGTDVKRLNSLITDPTVAIVGEASVISDSTPVFGEPVLTAKKYGGIVVMSSEVDEDAEVNLRSLMAERFGRQMAKAEQVEFISGATSGSQGLRVVSGVSTVTMGAGNTTGLNLSWDDLRDLITKIEEIDIMESMDGKFYMSPTFWNAVVQSKASGDGNYFNMFNSVPTRDNPLQAWGREVVLLNEMPTTASASTKFALYSDLKRHAFIGDRRGIRADILREGTVNSISLAETDQIGLRVTKRTAFTTALQNGLAWLVTSAS